MNQSLEEYRDAFQNEDVRYAVAEDFLSVYVAAQIKALRGDRTQQEIATAIGTQQSGVSRLENVNYSSWEVDTLRKLARAFGVRLKISFEDFGTLLTEMEAFSKETIQRHRFEDDPAFKEPISRRRKRKIRSSQEMVVLGRNTRRRRRRVVDSEVTRKPPAIEYATGVREMIRMAGSGSISSDFFPIQSGNNNSASSGPLMLGSNGVMSGNNAYGK